MKFRRVLALVIVLAVVSLTVVIWRHLANQSPEELIEALPENVDLALTDLHYTHNEEGRQRWVLDAENAAYQKQSSRLDLDNIDLRFFDAGQFGEVSLRAQEGSFDQAANEINLWDEVVLETSRGDKLTTERLRYEEATGLLSSNDPFRYSAPGLDLSGAGFRLDVERGYLLVEKNVQAILMPAESGLQQP